MADETLNYRATPEGTHVASGPGTATMTIYSSATYSFSDDPAVPRTESVRHSLQFGVDKSVALKDGQHLHVHGATVVAVTAEVPAPGHIE